MKFWNRIRVEVMSPAFKKFNLHKAFDEGRSPAQIRLRNKLKRSKKLKKRYLEKQNFQGLIQGAKNLTPFYVPPKG